MSGYFADCDWKKVHIARVGAYVAGHRAEDSRRQPSLMRAGPGVAAILNDHVLQPAPGRTGIGLDGYLQGIVFRRQLRFLRGAAAVALLPDRDCLRIAHRGAAVAELRSDRAAIERNQFVGGALKEYHRHRPRRRTRRIDRLRRRDDGDSGQRVGHHARQVLRHEATVGNSSRIDALWIDHSLRNHLRQHRLDEPDVVRLRLVSDHAAVVPVLVDAIRIHDDQPIRLRERVEVRVAFLLRVSAAAAVHHNERGQTFSVLAGRHIEQVAAAQAVHVDGVRDRIAGGGGARRQQDGHSDNDRGKNRDAGKHWRARRPAPLDSIEFAHGDFIVECAAPAPDLPAYSSIG